jgi:tyrosine-specific transport protein
MSLFHRRPKIELPLVQHQGIFRKQIGVFHGVALIVGMTIGAGVLGIPYAIAQVGLTIGLAYIIGLGLLVIGYNLLIGAIAVRTKENLQIVGLSRKYLGVFGEVLMTIVKYSSSAGAMVAYIIGQGVALSTLFGGSAYLWGLIFFAVGTFLIFNGINTIKTVDFWISLGVLIVVIIIAMFSFEHIQVENLKYFNMAKLLLPYGVILFAFHGGAAVIEAHSILANRNKAFKTTIIIAGIISMITYAIFAIVVLGVTGSNTTEIATVGLGQKVGPGMLIFGNIFAILAMSGSFLTVGLSVRDSLAWDYKIPGKIAALLVCGLPLVIFLLGLRQFITAIDLVGGVFVSLEMLVVVLIYWRAKQVSDLDPGKYKLHHTLLLVVLLLAALIVGAIYSILKLF